MKNRALNLRNTPTCKPFFAKKAVLGLFASACSLLALSGVAHGQQLYRVVGPDGKVTFTDRPPADANAKVSNTRDRNATANATSADEDITAGLPNSLRAVAQRFPVTIYTGERCGPCDGMRTVLRARGVPFSERTIKTPADAQALKRLAGDDSLPFATIGQQQLRGFSESDLNNTLDLAGYPKVSALPPNYKLPAPKPLVALTPAATTAAATATAPAPDNEAAAQRNRRRAATTPSEPPPSNPAGIRF